MILSGNISNITQDGGNARIPIFYITALEVEQDLN